MDANWRERTFLLHFSRVSVGFCCRIRKHPSESEGMSRRGWHVGVSPSTCYILRLHNTCNNYCNVLSLLQKHVISVYYGADCPRCIEYFQTQIFKDWNKIKRKVTLDLLPYGKSTVTLIYYLYNEMWYSIWQTLLPNFPLFISYFVYWYTGL